MRFFAPRFEELRRKYGSRIDFRLVYIEEAHAVDEWPISSGRYHDGVPVSVRQPKKLSERIQVAKMFLERYSLTEMPTLVDDPEAGNPFSEMFKPWPIRFYIVQQGIMKYIAEPSGCEYSLTDFIRALEKD